MNELLDQHKFTSKVNRNYLKLLNTIVILLSLLVVSLIAWKIWGTKNSTSPYLPQYTIYYVHSTLINFMVIVSVGILSGLVFRAMKHYATSSFVLLAFTVLAFVFDERVELYTYFYS